MQRYFDYYSTTKREKILVAALYFDKKVEKWFHNHLIGRPRLTWDELSRAILTKYDKTNYGQIVGSFNKLKQTGSIENYIDCFEDLRASMFRVHSYANRDTFCIALLVVYRMR